MVVLVVVEVAAAIVAADREEMVPALARSLRWDCGGCHWA